MKSSISTISGNDFHSKKRLIKIRLMLLITLVLLMSAASSTSFSQWSGDPTVNNPICTGSGVNLPAIESDDAGGAIIAWIDYRTTYAFIYAQRISSNGVIQWTTNGTKISNSYPGYWIGITGDGSGGAVVVWHNEATFQNYDIYAQKIDANGNLLWTNDGVGVCTDLNLSQRFPYVVSDGSGGAIVTWRADSTGGISDIYAQRLNADGVTLWTDKTEKGIPICTAFGNQKFSTNEEDNFPIRTQPIIEDGSTGAIVTWMDGINIYAQKINSAGVIQWTQNGVNLSSGLSNYSYNPRITSDGSEGAIVAFIHNNGFDDDIYAQKINSSGVIQWGSNGVPISLASVDQQYPDIIEDGTGGAFITWQSDMFSPNIYIQRVNSSGITEWTTNGILITPGGIYEFDPEITTDGTGGAILTWESFRNGMDLDIYAQRINSIGEIQWPIGGTPISTNTPEGLSVAFHHPALIGFDNGSAIITWMDERNFGQDLYASKVFPDGTLLQPTTFQLTVNVIDGWNMVSVPGLQSTNQNIDTWWSGRNPGTFVFGYDQTGYQSVTELVPGNGYWMDHLGAKVYNTGDEWPAEGINFVPNNVISANAGWNMIGGYHYNTPTSGVTTTPEGLQTGFVYGYTGMGYQIASELIPGHGYWIELTGAGDINLPGSTLKSSNKSSEVSEEDWGRIVITDKLGKNYTLYAVEDEVNLSKYQLPPSPPIEMFDIRYGSGRFVEDLSKGEKSILMQGLKYPVRIKTEGIKLKLKDETGKIVNTELNIGDELIINNSSVNRLFISGETTGNIPTEYSLEQNYPNPFNPTTTIKFSLPVAETVSLNIYNTLGEKIAELVHEILEAGIYSYQWDASKISTGLYIYELRTGNFVSTKKMMLIK